MPDPVWVLRSPGWYGADGDGPSAAARILRVLGYDADPMKVTTSFRRGPFALNLAFAIFCLVGALWGAYDYWIWYPALERAGREIEDARAVMKEVEAAAGTAPGAPGASGGASPPLSSRPLSEAETRRYEEARATVARITAEHNGEPRKLAAYDRPLQLWLWVIGCGVLGLPYFIWPLVRMLRRRWTLEEDGTLRTPWRTIPFDQVQTIDMSRWCSPTGSKRSTWKAWLVLADGSREELDDHDYRDMHLIIGFYAHRFHPEEWTEEAKRVPSEEEASPTQPIPASDAAPE